MGCRFTPNILILIIINIFLSACTEPKDTYRADNSPGAKVVLVHHCFDCHGENGISNQPQFPNLAGQNKLYIFYQLQAFKQSGLDLKVRESKSGRFNDLMSQVSVTLSEKEMRDVAAFYSNQQCSQIKKITAGINPYIPEKLPLCAKCHNKNGISHSDGIPNITSQKYSYLTSQLRAFRASATNIPDIYIEHSRRTHDVMNEQAELLTDNDIHELATYYSSLRCQ